MLKKILLVAAITVPVSSALANDTGWIDGKKLWGMTPKISKEYLPTKIACKDNGRAGTSLRSTMVKFDVIPANGQRFFWWVVWDKHQMKDVKDKMKRKGFHLVSKDSFRRKSGMLFQCLLFHK